MFLGAFLKKLKKISYPWTFTAAAVLVTQTFYSKTFEKELQQYTICTFFIYFSFLNVFFLQSRYIFRNFGLQWNVCFNKYRMAALETYWRNSKIYICLTFEIHTCTAYITYIWTEFRVWPVIVDLCCSAVRRTSVTHLSRMLLLWSFKAKREYSGVQRQRNMTSTQGQTPVFTFIMAFFFILPWFWDWLYSTAGMRQSTHSDSGPQGREV